MTIVDTDRVIFPGLCSVTFRKLSAREIVALALENKLAGIEWGGDLHVPVGQLEVAREVRRLCLEAGIRTPSYGSYFRVEKGAAAWSFDPVLETAVALGAETIRVWAGGKSSREMDAEDWAGLVEFGRSCAEKAHQAGCVIGFEYHLGTATDANEAARKLIEQMEHPAARLYWQPRQRSSEEERMAGLCEILPFLAHLHVFRWVGDQDLRLPLADGAEEWRKYLARAARAEGDHFAYLEFVEGDEVASLGRDAATLRMLLAE